jgi:hypothetical protein
MTAKKYYAKENNRWCILGQCKRPRFSDVLQFATDSVQAYAEKFEECAFDCPLIVLSKRDNGMSMADSTTIWLDVKADWLIVCHELAHSLYMQHMIEVTRTQHNRRHRQITDWLCSRLFTEGYLNENFNI